jgi:hypothetical protein
MGFLDGASRGTSMEDLSGRTFPGGKIAWNDHADFSTDIE